MRSPDSQNLRRVSDSQNLRFSESQISDSKHLRSSDSESQILGFSECQILRISDFQNLRFSTSQILRLSNSQNLKFSDSQILRISECQTPTSLHVPKPMSRCPDRVAMAPHGLILSQDGATASRNLFKYLPAPGEAIFSTKRTQIMKQSGNPRKLLFFRVFFRRWRLP